MKILLLLLFVNYVLVNSNENKCKKINFITPDSTVIKSFLETYYSPGLDIILHGTVFSNASVTINQTLYNVNTKFVGSIYNVSQSSVEFILNGPLSIESKTQTLFKGHCTVNLLINYKDNIKEFTVNSTGNIINFKDKVLHYKKFKLEMNGKIKNKDVTLVPNRGLSIKTSTVNSFLDLQSDFTVKSNNISGDINTVIHLVTFPSHYFLDNIFDNSTRNSKCV